MSEFRLKLLGLAKICGKPYGITRLIRQVIFVTSGKSSKQVLPRLGLNKLFNDSSRKISRFLSANDHAHAKDFANR